MAQAKTGKILDGRYAIFDGGSVLLDGVASNSIGSDKESVVIERKYVPELISVIVRSLVLRSNGNGYKSHAVEDLKG